MGRGPELGTTYLCGAHGFLSTAVLYKGEIRMRHDGDQAWCLSKRFTERQVRVVDRETALASLTGEDAGAP